ncbi:pyrophosphatase PpaX [Caloramator quimbayensis]|uniref:Pyrophosphatase PpaX n=1 Tax=Caloramator quimbayensis TaxID=1147123 RepID=A0A1T4WLS9_9CLOT|nr:pyrophosphatase PpaX [Caloramator quimbayensis]SKA78293.1 pyrophosphatase PpaX [Caloramator quimbayensis]
MIKAVLFDFDGTLVDTNRLIIESYKHTYKKHLNLDVNEEDIKKYFGEPLITTLSRYDKLKAQEMFKTYIEYNESRHDDMVQAFEGVNETLKALKEKGLKVGIVTSKRRVIAQRGLNITGITEPLDVFITCEDTQKHKPHGEPVLKACEILNISPNEAIYVGDTSFDILCGKNAGALTCLEKYTALPLEELLKYGPDYTIDRLYDLLDAV